jgi:hypothetical protein
MKQIKKVVVYYDDNTYEEVGNKAAVFGPVTNSPFVGNPLSNCCIVCGDPTGHGGLPCPKMYPVSTTGGNKTTGAGT